MENTTEQQITALVDRIRNNEMKLGPRVEAAEKLCDLLYGPQIVTRASSVVRVDLKTKVLSALRDQPMSGNDLALNLKCNRNRLFRALAELQNDKIIRRDGGVWVTR